MTTLTTTNTSNSSIARSSCTICQRNLYSFEEILTCRLCQESNHWRCVKPDTISLYGEHENYVCNKCQDRRTPTQTSSYRKFDHGLKIKSTDQITTNYRDFAAVPSKSHTSDTFIDNHVRYFEDTKRQLKQNQTTTVSEIDAYVPLNAKRTERLVRDDQFTNQRTQRERVENSMKTTNENDTSSIFHIDYEYTPLADYSDMKSNQITYDNNINNNQNTYSTGIDPSITSRYGGGLHYMNYGYDPTSTRIIEAPSGYLTNHPFSTVENLTNRNRPTTFVTKSNLYLNENNVRGRQQHKKNSFIQSTPSLSTLHEADRPIFQPTFEKQIEHGSTNDTGSEIISAITNATPQSNDDQSNDKSVKDLVKHIEKQLDTNAQKTNEKLDNKLSNLENVIRQQTNVMKNQDETIERLKARVIKSENKPDQLHDSLQEHEKHENEQENNLSQNRLKKPDADIRTNKQLTQKQSVASTSTTDTNEQPIKKTSAPLHGKKWPSTTLKEDNITTNKLVTNSPKPQKRLPSETSSNTSLSDILPASSRLDNIIREPYPKVRNVSPAHYRLAEVHQQNSSRTREPLSIKQENVVTTIHRVPVNKAPVKSSISSASSSSASPKQTPSLSKKYSESIKPKPKPIPADINMRGWLRKQNRDAYLKRIREFYFVLMNHQLFMYQKEDDTKPHKTINLKGSKVHLSNEDKQGPTFELNWTNEASRSKHYYLYADDVDTATKWVTNIQNAIHQIQDNDTGFRGRADT